MNTIATRITFGEKVVSVVASTALALSMTPIFAMSSVAYADTASWYSESGTVFELTTADQMTEFASLVNSGTTFAGQTVKLGADITLTAADWDAIGNSADHAFAGTFDGNGKTVSGLSVTDITGGYEGLFGHNDGTVKNVTVSGSITATGSGSDGVSGVVGVNDGTVQGATNNVAISITGGSDSYAVGGVVGQNNGTVSQSVNNAAVTNSKATGGVVGRSYSTDSSLGLIAECVNNGTVTGTYGQKDQIGGIVGGLGDKNNTATTYGTVINSYNTGAVSNPNGRWVAGIAGFSTVNTKINNCFNVGVIGNAYKDNGGLITYADTGAIAECNNNYALEQEGYTGASLNGTSKTAAEIASADFVNLLGNAYTAGESYPVLAWQVASEPQATGSAVFGTDSDPVFVGGTFEVTVGVEYAGSIVSAELGLTYNPAVATIAKIEYAEGIENGYLGPEETSVGDFDNEVGTAKVSFLGDTEFDATEGFVVATITFNAVAEGTVNLAFADGAVAAAKMVTADIDLEASTASVDIAGIEFEVSEEEYAAGYHLVTCTSDIPEGSVPTFKGENMFKVGDDYVALVKDAESVTAADFAVVAGEAGSIVRDGDVNANGAVNIVDAQVAYDAATAVYTDFTVLPMSGWLNADVNNDDSVTAADAFAIQYKVHNGAFA